jgi:hypothetical protein
MLTCYGWSSKCCEFAILIATKRLSKIEPEIDRSFRVPLAILIEATWKCCELKCDSLEECLRFLSADISELRPTQKTDLLNEEVESLLSIYGNELVLQESPPSSGITLSLEFTLSKYSSINSLPSFLSHWSSGCDHLVLEVRNNIFKFWFISLLYIFRFTFLPMELTLRILHFQFFVVLQSP